MSNSNKIRQVELEEINQVSPSSITLLKRILNHRKANLKARPQYKIDKIICKNGCRLGSD
jgi:hypothetical protein